MIGENQHLRYLVRLHKQRPVYHLALSRYSTVCQLENGHPRWHLYEPADVPPVNGTLCKNCSGKNKQVN